MKVFAVTGLLGAGKTTACNFLKEQGFPILDVDHASKLMIDKNTEDGKEGFAKVYRAFGSTVLDKLGNLDRGALRKRMMINPQDRENLENILNPLLQNFVRKKMTEWKAAGEELGFLEGSRFFETGLDKVVAGVIRVSAAEKERIKRLVIRDSMGKEEVAMLVQMQDQGMMERFSKLEWKNDKGMDVLEKQINAFLDIQVGPATES